MDAFPCAPVLAAAQLDQLLDQTLFRHRELAPLALAHRTARASEHQVHDRAHQLSVQNQQGRAGKRPGLHDVDAGRQLDRAQKVAVATHDRIRVGDFRVALHEGEHRQPQTARKALVDQFQCRHPAPDDPLLAGQVVGLRGRTIVGRHLGRGSVRPAVADGLRLGRRVGRRIRGAAFGRIQQRVDLVLRQVLLAHVTAPASG